MWEELSMDNEATLTVTTHDSDLVWTSAPVEYVHWGDCMVTISVADEDDLPDTMWYINTDGDFVKVHKDLVQAREKFDALKERFLKQFR
jgi:hypothetical protein